MKNDEKDPEIDNRNANEYFFRGLFSCQRVVVSYLSHVDKMPRGRSRTNDLGSKSSHQAGHHTSYKGRRTDFFNASTAFLNFQSSSAVFSYHHLGSDSGLTFLRFAFTLTYSMNATHYELLVRPGKVQVNVLRVISS